FEGEIPKGEYGAGKVIIWDAGHWETNGDPSTDWRAGKLKLRLKGHKLQGGWTLVRTGQRQRDPNTSPASGSAAASAAKTAWLLIKEKDEYARPESEYEVTQAQPDSVATGTAPAAGAYMPETLEP